MREDGRDSGFSLIEMIVALALIALVGSVLSYAVRPPGMASSPREVARLIAGEARAASWKAVSSGRNSMLRVDLDRREVSIDGAPARLRIPAGQSITVKTAEQLVTTRRSGAIEFFPDGSSSGGEIIVGTGAANRYVVRVFWLTGEITARPTS